MNDARTVCLLGKGALAVRIAKWFYESHEWRLETVVTVDPEPDWAPSLADWAIEHPVTHLFGYHEALPAHDLALSVFYDRRIGVDVIDRMGRCLNLHNSRLPRYRGVNPINWALYNGERSHGVTIHEIDAGLDTGPIVSQCSYPIWPELDEVEDVYQRAIEWGWQLFLTTMPLLDRLVAKRQDESRATTYRAHDAARLGDRQDWRRPTTEAA